MSEWHKKRGPFQRITHAEDGTALLPDVPIRPELIERAWRVFTVGEAFDWRWPPDVIERQDAELLDGLLALMGASALVKAMLEEESKRGPCEKSDD